VIDENNRTADDPGEKGEKTAANAAAAQPPPARVSRDDLLTGFAVGAGLTLGAAVGMAAASAAALRGVAAWRRARRETFRNRVVLITGGSRGLGLELARLFADEGAYVAIASRDLNELLAVKAELRDRGAADVDAFQCDVTDRAQADAAIIRMVSRWGRIDVLVNNAGIILSAPLERVRLEDFERAMAVHFWAPLYLMQAAAPHMRRQRTGRIVNIASIGGRIAVPHLLPYCASKFALVGLSDGMRAELARHHIAVTTVCPGLMRTGSHLNANFRGRHELEFALFSLLDAWPLTSINAERAARKIVEATRRRRAHLTITPQAKLAAALNNLTPETIATVMAIASSLLPRSGGKNPFEEKPGWQSRPRWLPSIATRLADRAAVRNNEIPHAQSETR
jgi:NAD(P)-dependent dehydrogenase (short-subunit alcohol dehydrogenase family)